MELDNTEQGPDAAERQAVIKRAVEGLLASIPPQVAEAIRLGAIPHWFDERLLTRLRGEELDVALLVTYLLRFRFVRQDAQGQFRYHDEMRDYLLAWWRQERRQQYEEANRAALAHFKALAEAATPVERPVYEREVLYHLLLVDEAEGLQYLNAQFEDVRGRYQLGLAEGFVAQAAQLKAVLTDVGRRWVEYFEARLDLVYRRGDAGEATFKELIEGGPDPVMRAMACWSLGEIRVNQQRWSQAIGLYHASLDSLQQEQVLMYGVRVMLALGNAYCDLANNSGGFQAQSSKHFGVASQFLHHLQHLPFLIYEWLVRRVNFLPNWYFGTNYQDWIIAYLLLEATRWYRRAEGQFKEIEDTPDLAEARLALAELEHQLGRWSRARRRYTLLLEADQVKGSLYRTARVRLGQGRAFLDEGNLIKAEIALAEALETFRRFHDDRSIGVTAALLGRVHASLGRLDDAVSAYVESAQAFAAIRDQLTHTKVVWALEDLAQGSTLLDGQKQQIDTVVGQVVERHYLTRFPESLLRRFRSLAFLGAFLAYILAFVVGFGLTIAVVIIETVFLLPPARTDAQKMVIDALVLMAAATLPVPLSLWLYRLIYSLLGTLVVRVLGRRLIPIERDQPSHIVTNAVGLTRHDASRGLSRTVTWSSVSSLASVDYYQWQRPIHLISSTILVANSGMTVVVDAITTGYDYLKQDMVRHLSRQRDGVKQHSLDFVIFDSRWMLTAVTFSLTFALYLFSTPGFAFTVQQQSSGKTVPLPFSLITVWFVSTLLLVFPAVVFWRLVSHGIAVRNALKTYQVKPIIPSWVSWLAAIVSTVIATLWIGLLVLLSRPS